MTINWYGIVFLFFITFIVLIKKSFRFLDAFILFIAFSSTAIFFVDDETAVNLPFTLFFLAFLAFLIRSFLDSKIVIIKEQKISIIWLITIGLIAIISEIMPFIINGSYNVLDRYGSLVYYAEEIPLIPKIQWITQLLYFLIGLLITFLVATTYNKVSDLKNLLRLLIAGISFLIFWGWFEYLCFFTGIPYPYEIFDHIGMSREGTLEIDGWPRMSSITLEPSYLAQIMIPVTPFLFWFSKSDTQIKLFNKKALRGLYVISIITALLAYTTTGILGAFAVAGLWLKNKLKTFNKRSRYFLITVYFLTLLGAIFFIVQYLIKVSESFSGVERFKTFYLGFEYFLDFPILGLGWGVFPTYDFIVNLLVNFGIIGTIAFSILLYNIFTKLSGKKRKNNILRPLYIASAESLFLLLIVSQLSGFIYHSQYFWMYLGVALSVSSINEESK